MLFLYFFWSSLDGIIERYKKEEIVEGFTLVTPVVRVSTHIQSVQHYVIKFVSDLRQVDGFLLVHRFPQPIKPTATM
jgi:hypothetical protein